MPSLLAFVRDPEMAVRLAAAAERVRASQPMLRVRWLNDWREVETHLWTRGVCCVVFDPREVPPERIGNGSSQSGISLLAYCRSTRSSLRDLFRLSNAGVSDIVAFDEDDHVDAFCDRISEHLRDSLSDWMLRAIAPVPPRVARLIAWMCDERLAPTPLAAARQYASHPSTLRAHLARAGLPPTAHLIGWTRLLRVTALLDAHDRTVESAALDAGYSSLNAFGNQLRRYAELSPSALKTVEGRDRLLRRFASCCTQPRRPGIGRRRSERPRGAATTTDRSVCHVSDS